MPTPIRIALYSHDALGLGHVRRNRALAHAFSRHLPRLTGADVSGLLITGQPAATQDTLPDGWDWLVVPGLAPDERGYAPRHLGVTMPQLTELRAEILGAAIAELAPDLLIVDRHPFGVDGELRPALDRLREVRPDASVVLGLREVLDSAAVAQAEWDGLGGGGAVRERFDEVWIYGDGAVHDPCASGELPEELVEIARTTGYLGHGRPTAGITRYQEPFVVTTVGGGSDGAAIVAQAAAAPLPAGHRHLVICGPQMTPAEVGRARRLAGPATEIVEAVPDVQDLLPRAAAIVCMGGYNTVCELLVCDTPALVVPRARRRQEQRIRAAALAARELVDVADPAALTAAGLGHWFASAVTRRTDRSGVDLDGLERVAALAARRLAPRSSDYAPTPPDSPAARAATVPVTP